MTDNVIDVLLGDNISPTQSGFTYLSEAIYMICERWERSYDLWALYKQVGIKYGKTQKAVDHAIRYSLSSAGIDRKSSMYIILTADKIRRSLKNK